MQQLKLEFQIHEKDHFPKVSAQIVVDPYTYSETSRMPAVTRACDAMHELESELKRLEKQIGLLRSEAKRKFESTGIKV